jgi:hypothetical protein
MTSTNIYYIYAYIRSKDSETAKAGTPYYIGKGTRRRAWEQHRDKDRSATWTPKDKSKIIILESNLTDLGALALERRLIRWWGRKDIGTGILRNKTDGGEGASFPGKLNPMYGSCRTGKLNPMYGKLHSAETRQKLSLSKIGKTPHNKGVPMSEEQKVKLRKPKSDTHIQNLKVAQQKRRAKERESLALLSHSESSSSS